MYLVILFKLFNGIEGNRFSVQIIMHEGENNIMKPYGLTVRGVIKNKDDEILLLKRHPASRSDPEKWELPGGKVEKGESFDDALVREIKEETNLDVKVGDFCEAVQKDSLHKRTVQLIMYLDDAEGDIKISDEHTEWMWASVGKIKKLEISVSLKKTLEKKKWLL